MKRIWRAWKGVAHKIISAQNFVLMSGVYWFAVAPVAICMKLIRFRLLSTPSASEEVDSYWEDKEGLLSMDRAQKMF
ncbi:MAG TPA: hypothetical protein QGF58_02035 [Myxococcota bacterium]|nr:hypothetical protein [Myxococcota bacterium]